jgi:hypothetical protein
LPPRASAAQPMARAMGHGRRDRRPAGYHPTRAGRQPSVRPGRPITPRLERVERDTGAAYACDAGLWHSHPVQMFLYRWSRTTRPWVTSATSLRTVRHCWSVNVPHESPAGKSCSLRARRLGCPAPGLDQLEVLRGGELIHRGEASGRSLDRAIQPVAKFLCRSAGADGRSVKRRVRVDRRD